MIEHVRLFVVVETAENGWELATPPIQDRAEAALANRTLAGPMPNELRYPRRNQGVRAARPSDAIEGRRYPYETILPAPVERTDDLFEIGRKILHLWGHYAKPIRQWYEWCHRRCKELAHRFKIKGNNP